MFKVTLGGATLRSLSLLSCACRPPARVQLTLEEVMTTTAYLDLFLRSVTEPALLQTLLSFILLHQHEGVHILDTLVSRINTPFQVRGGIPGVSSQMQHDSGLINTGEKMN